MQKPDVENFYTDYINDVLQRHELVFRYQEKRKAFWQERPLDEIKEHLRKIMEAENIYRTPEVINPSNNFSMLEESIIGMAILRNFSSDKDVSEIVKTHQEERKKIKELSEEKKKNKIRNH